MDQQLDDAISELQTYPPPKAGSNYVRTGNLRDAWRRDDVRLTGSGLVGRIHNDKRYAGFVHGNEEGLEQQEQHKTTGWPLMAETLRTTRTGSSFRDELARAIKRL